MILNLGLPDIPGIQLDDVMTDEKMIQLSLTSTHPDVACPLCLQASSHLHSRYERLVADLPAAGLCVRISFSVRRFFCDNKSCSRRIFCERLGTAVTVYARRTSRLTIALEHLAFQVGGETGARLMIYFGIVVSPDTLLRLIRRSAESYAPTPRVLGVDDWAKRKGQSYGTILIDLENHQPVDVLPERTSEALSDWLQAHPGVEIISRDRAEAYAEGATKGAPGAIQVADRWHLLKNLSETLERLLLHHQSQVNEALAPEKETPQQNPAALQFSPDEPSASSCLTAPVAAPPLNRHEQLRQKRRANRLARYQKVCALHLKGLSISAIAQQVGSDRKTIRRYLNAPSFPEQQKRRPKSSILDPYKPYLNERLSDAGNLSSIQLLREIRTQGYRGGQSVLFAYLAARRKASGLPSRTRRQAPSAKYTMSIRRLVGLILRNPQTIKPQDQERLESLGNAHPALKEAVTLSHAFARVVRERHSEALEVSPTVLY